ncbi:hypothetical protein ACK3TF_001026 [Chlorella vulgaris]
MAKPTTMSLPRFAFNQPLPQYYSLPPSQQQVVYPIGLEAPPATARGLYSSQPAASQPQAAFPPWSQRSQLDNVVVEEQLEESMPPTMVDAAAVGSAPHPSDPCFAPSQPEVNALGPAPAQTATRLLNEINRKGLSLDAQTLLTGLSAKLEGVEGRQGQLAGAVEELKQGLAQHGHKLEGIEQTCTQLLQSSQGQRKDQAISDGLPVMLARAVGVQAIKAMNGASSSITEGLRTLLDRNQPQQAPITGDMATQTSPAALAKPPWELTVTAAARPVPTDLLQAYSQRRVVSADTVNASQAVVHKTVMLQPAAFPQRGIHSSAPPAVPAASLAPAASTRPPQTTRRSPRLAVVSAAGQPCTGGTRSGAAAGGIPPAKPRARSGIRAGSQLAAASPSPAPSFSRKRRLDDDRPSSAPTHIHARASSRQRSLPAALKPVPRPQRPVAAGRAETLFDSLFAEEQGEEHAAEPGQLKPVPVPKLTRLEGEQLATGGGRCDLAAAVQARLQRHKDKMALARRRRTSLTRRQQEEAEE